MSSAWESFHLSMYILTGAEPQRERLIKACKMHLVRLAPKEVPSEVRTEFSWLAREITRNPGKLGECAVTNTVATLEDREVSMMIHAIIRMYDAVTRYQPILALKERDSMDS